MENFLMASLPQELVAALARMQFLKPTPIQAQAIPLALEGRDILASAQTGTGKTGAFAIPLVARLLQTPNQGGALILTPTRELAVQVHDVIKKLLVGQQVLYSALLVGGESMFHQLKALRSQPRIIVGTPGRVNDHLNRKSLSLKQTNILVLDETDRMLDMGFGIQLETIIPKLAHDRQTMLFSATLPPKIVQLAQKMLNNPERIAVGSANTPAPKIQQETVKTTDVEKYNLLLSALQTRDGYILIFVNTKHGAERLTKKLKGENYLVDTLHGNLRQNQRERVTRAFRSKKFQIMVATDIAARGLDIPHIEHVINYDLPMCPEDYIHRIGRTARASATGAALNLITAKDMSKWRAIERLLNPNAPANSGNSGSKTNERPKKNVQAPLAFRQFKGF